MTTPPALRYRELLQTILTHVSDEERDELALEVDRIDDCFRRLGELLSCLTREDRAIFFQAFAVSLGDLIFRSSQQTSGASFNPDNAEINSIDSILCVASVTTSLEDCYVKLFSDEFGLKVCRTRLASTRSKFAQMQR